ncbi:DUF732 domain-containing protein [Mycobacterium shigaense]|uniref:Uncharacterized protein n=1 Tax=Mycobacterium shigaense TaxID=722731 RepID=A0A1Z4EEE7_9MYCO|nr:DUF732 domain-containing protein [Mycobacterium shigaense]MEA1121868.1 DUF732 domain-containing protein [Mycobacterium shigaense]PRI16108.1 hypothetical protein B2J96_04560 [Mycobacterium shigaense]BAX91300.1 hypothetical protein MSG_01141 [Mycobacterium shigaense]
MTNARIRKFGAALSLSAAGLMSAAALLGPAPIARADSADNQFLAILKKDDINHTSSQAAIAAGHKVCEYLDTGMNLTNVEQDVENSSGLPDYDTGFFVGAAIKAYCPQFMPDVSKNPPPQPAGEQNAPQT